MTIASAPSETNIALFRKDDKRYVQVARSFRGPCTREQWDHPLYFQEVLRLAWIDAIKGIALEGYEFVTAAPVTLYRRVSDGAVVYADVRRQYTDAPTFITPLGRRLLAPLKGQFIVQRTTYARWAEGPLFHLDPFLQAAPTPLDDPVIQKARHQNSALRELIDANLGASEFAPFANTDDGNRANLVDFKIVGVFKRPDFQPLTSLQTGQPRYLQMGDGSVADLNEEYS